MSIINCYTEIFTMLKGNTEKVGEFQYICSEIAINGLKFVSGDYIITRETRGLTIHNVNTEMEIFFILFTDINTITLSQ